MQTRAFTFTLPPGPPHPAPDIRLRDRASPARSSAPLTGMPSSSSTRARPKPESAWLAYRLPRGPDIRLGQVRPVRPEREHRDRRRPQREFRAGQGRTARAGGVANTPTRSRPQIVSCLKPRRRRSGTVHRRYGWIRAGSPLGNGGAIEAQADQWPQLPVVTELSGET